MVDKVKPLKFENSATGGTEVDYLPTEVDSNEDYLAGKGISFENSDSYLLQKIGGVVRDLSPNYSNKWNYSGDNLASVEVFNGLVQTTINRIAKGTITLTSDNVTSEVWEIYSTTDGTTVLATTTFTHTYTLDVVQKTEAVES